MFPSRSAARSWRWPRLVLRANELTLGGFTGIAQVINFFVPALPVGVTVIVLNAPLFLMSLKRFGKRFLVRSFFAVAVNSIFIDLINAVYTFQPMDKLLGCIYGGVLVGVSLGWLLREEATTGGTELGAWLLKAKIPGSPSARSALPST